MITFVQLAARGLTTPEALPVFWTLTRKFIGTFTRLTLISLRSASTSLTFGWVSLTLLSELAPERSGMKINIILHEFSSLSMSKGLCRNLQMCLEVPSQKSLRFYFRKSHTTQYCSTFQSWEQGMLDSQALPQVLWLCTCRAWNQLLRSSDKGHVGRNFFFFGHHTSGWRTQGPAPFHANMHGALPSWQNTPGAQHHCWRLYEPLCRIIEGQDDISASHDNTTSHI